jgi:hypothetical protein
MAVEAVVAQVTLAELVLAVLAELVAVVLVLAPVAQEILEPQTQAVAVAV